MAARTTPKKPKAVADGDDGFEMRKDGKCVLTVRGETYRFRRPRLGEFRELREKLYERDDESLRLTAELNDRVRERDAAANAANTDDAEEKSQTERLQASLEAKKALRDLDRSVSALTEAWMVEALETLKEDEDAELPGPDDWPPEMAETSFVAELVNHWRHRPLAPGAPSPT